MWGSNHSSRTGMKKLHTWCGVIKDKPHLIYVRAVARGFVNPLGKVDVVARKKLTKKILVPHGATEPQPSPCCASSDARLALGKASIGPQV